VGLRFWMTFVDVNFKSKDNLRVTGTATPCVVTLDPEGS
jgi:hypothetical protein